MKDQDHEQTELDVWMRELAEPSGKAEVPPRLPKAGQTWWRAQVRQRQAAAERAVRPLAIAEAAGPAAAGLGLACWVAYQALRLDWAGLPAAVRSLAPAQPVVLLAAAFSALAIAVTLHRLLARD